jgi:predicted MFS family arabinose efflux permease
MNRDLRLLSLSLIIWGVGEGLFLYLNPVYLAQLGANPVQIGAILGLAGFALTLGHLPAGYLADRFGPKRTMVAAWFAGLAAAWLMALARALPLFVAGLVLYSLSGFVLAPMSSYVTTARGRLSVARALTSVSAFFNLGVVVGPAAGGLLADRLGLRSIYGFAAALFSLSTLLVLLLRPQAAQVGDRRFRARALMANLPLLRFLGLVFLTMFVLYLSWPLTPNYLQQERGVSLSLLGAFGSLNALGVVALNLILGGMTPLRAFWLVQVFVGLSVGLIWKGSRPWVAAGYFLAGGTRTARNLINAQVQALSAPNGLGLSFGLTETINGLAILVSSTLAGALFESNPQWPFLASLLGLPLVLLLNLRYNRSVPAAGSVARPAIDTPEEMA